MVHLCHTTQHHIWWCTCATLHSITYDGALVPHYTASHMMVHLCHTTQHHIWWCTCATLHSITYDGALVPHYTASHMMVHSCHTTQHHILQDSNLYSHCHENLKSHMSMLGLFWNKQTWYHNICINKIWCFHAKDCNNDHLLGSGAMQFDSISKQPAVCFQDRRVSVQQIPPKLCYPPTKLHCVTSHNIKFLKIFHTKNSIPWSRLQSHNRKKHIKYLILSD